MSSNGFPYHENYSSGTPLFKLIVVTVTKLSIIASKGIFHAL
jgi:hypothetical protein